MPRNRKRTPLQAALVIVVALIVYAGKQWGGLGDASVPAGGSTAASSTQVSRSTDTPPARINSIIRGGLSGEMIQTAATVTKTLPDDDEGSRHQRFIVKLNSGKTLLIAHNIDLAKRVPVDEGDSVRFRGQFETNERGGVIHWTHHDPAGRRPGGWIEHDGRQYK
ncbi:MAG: hypothetical protein DHS20C16_31800 [Phycisphaerae bacterium]|nr:MAG: hypothetical protein DHS20C16_31800 [Phycisphaerae bacterium]